MRQRQATTIVSAPNEAPPAVISIFLGDELTDILNALESDKHYDPKEAARLHLGTDILPKLPKDTTDRNRTSPFAFTGNKFEFRMVGSSSSIADCNTVLNTAVAESLRQFADILETADNFQEELNHLIRDTIKKHKRIIFNGNGYNDDGLKKPPMYADCSTCAPLPKLSRCISPRRT